MSEAKRHHYLPVSYLRRFTNDGTDRVLLLLFGISTQLIGAIEAAWT
jgi:hypothetical protein